MYTLFTFDAYFKALVKDEQECGYKDEKMIETANHNPDGVRKNSRSREIGRESRNDVAQRNQPEAVAGKVDLQKQYTD